MATLVLLYNYERMQNAESTVQAIVVSCLQRQSIKKEGRAFVTAIGLLWARGSLILMHLMGICRMQIDIFVGWNLEFWSVTVTFIAVGPLIYYSPKSTFTRKDTYHWMSFCSPN